ncbi:MAG: hypothetical protein BGO30_00715 [Bacteroidetes bacterium 41-46]|nr:MAG: hypothetical protein BGO30_00715 [Bacteroidetes bacterium 41-46]
MKIGNKKQLITAVVLFSLILGFIIVGISVVNEEDKLLEENPVHSLAVIVETYVGAKARDYVRYEFVVNGKVYDGHQNYMPHQQPVDIGDTCEVVYAESNPKISRLLTDDNNFLKIKRKNKELKFFQE